MEWTYIEKGNAAGAEFEIAAQWIGEDLLVGISGGEKPHIGCLVQASPRPSLTGEGQLSATSSVWNRTGHKDEFICRPAAEYLCRKTGREVVCTGGFHVDHLTKEQIDELLFQVDQTVRLLAEKINRDCFA